MKRYKFTAAIQRSTGSGAYVIFPHSVPQEFGVKAGFQCRQSLPDFHTPAR